MAPVVSSRLIYVAFLILYLVAESFSWVISLIIRIVLSFLPTQKKKSAVLRE